uniref:Transmembrane protein n=1 Tax=Ochrobactrum sp. LM19 TaxID=1449781 RepID=A0A0D5A198_9HYPH|nr:hypothetical protein [Ochrobactrum sp. LM19]AJW29978.1 hypothetical protein pLM19O2_p33 [Ochrobactrum sp. LM19]
MVKRMRDMSMEKWLDPKYVDTRPDEVYVNGRRYVADEGGGALGILLIPLIFLFSSQSFLAYLYKIFSDPITHVYDVGVVLVICGPIAVWAIYTLVMMAYNLVYLTIWAVWTLFTKGPVTLWRHIIQDIHE